MSRIARPGGQRGGVGRGRVMGSEKEGINDLTMKSNEYRLMLPSGKWI